LSFTFRRARTKGTGIEGLQRLRAMHGDAPRLSHSTHITDVIWSEGQDRHMTSPWAEGGEWFQGPGGYTEKIGY